MKGETQLLKILQKRLENNHFDSESLLKNPFAVYWHERRNIVKFISNKDLDFEEKYD
jgi:hypothetical protein